MGNNLNKLISIKQEISYGEDKNVVVFVEIKDISESDIKHIRELLQKTFSEIEDSLFKNHPYYTH